jgi:DNA-binding MarR family transcriptional regulator
VHVAFFSVKRVHLRVLHVTRRLLRMSESELTPARFDMLRIVEAYGEHGVGQQRIQDLLGVSAPTVSRMLKALEEVGFVVRERMEHDARFRRVYLTELGLERLAVARMELVDFGLNDRTAQRGLDPDPETARQKLYKLREFLSSMRVAYTDPAPFEHPWTARQIDILAYRAPASFW